MTIPRTSNGDNSGNSGRHCKNERAHRRPSSRSSFQSKPCSFMPARSTRSSLMALSVFARCACWVGMSRTTGTARLVMSMIPPCVTMSTHSMAAAKRNLYDCIRARGFRHRTRHHLHRHERRFGIFRFRRARAGVAPPREHQVRAHIVATRNLRDRHPRNQRLRHNLALLLLRPPPPPPPNTMPLRHRVECQYTYIGPRPSS